jgi:hypothetical protein
MDEILSLPCATKGGLPLDFLLTLAAGFEDWEWIGTLLISLEKIERVSRPFRKYYYDD